MPNRAVFLDLSPLDQGDLDLARCAAPSTSWSATT